MTALAIIFVVIAAMLCAAALLALLRVAHMMLSGADALERDGIARGRPAPPWTLADAEGTAYSSPPERPLQLIVFADHGLKSFPSVVSGLRALQADDDLEIVIVTRGPAAPAVPVLAQLGLAGVPVLAGSPRLYASYNVRVMPFVIVVDAAGLVRGSSLVNHDWQLAKLRQVAAIPPDQDEIPAPAAAAAAMAG
jgi:hypothetical protein